MANPITSFLKGFSSTSQSKDITVEGGSTGITTFGFDSDWENTSYHNLVDLAVKNGLSRRAIDFIATNLSGIPLKVVDVTSEGEEEDLGEHPILDLLHSPGGPSNNRYTKEWLFEGKVWAMMGGGEYWLRSMSPDNGPNADMPRKLDLFDKSDFGQFKVDQNGFVNGYILHKQLPYTRKTVEGDTEEILHSFNYNPRNKFRGLPILVSVMRSLSLMEDFDNWNKNVSQNKGQIPGWLMPVGLEPGDQISKDDRKQAQEQVDETINNARKGHKWTVLGGAFEPKENNITPKEASFGDAIKHHARMVAATLGIDPTLLGDDAAQTYNNYRTALIIAYTTRIIPMLEFFLSSINRFVTPKFEDAGQRLRVTFDPMEIDALREVMLEKIDTLKSATDTAILTPDEARSILGREPKGADSIVMSLNLQTHETLFSETQELDTGLRELEQKTDEELIHEVEQVINGDVNVDQHRNGVHA